MHGVGRRRMPVELYLTPGMVYTRVYIYLCTYIFIVNVGTIKYLLLRCGVTVSYSYICTLYIHIE